MCNRSIGMRVHVSSARCTMPWERPRACRDPHGPRCVLRAGLVLDPYEAARLKGPMMPISFLAGCIKAAIGLLVRPSIGILESSSKLLQVRGVWPSPLKP